MTMNAGTHGRAANMRCAMQGPQLPLQGTPDAHAPLFMIIIAQPEA